METDANAAFNVRNWFFDFDGTLADTEPDIRGTWLRALASLGLDCPGFAKVYRTGPSLDDISRALFPGISAAMLEKIRETFKREYDSSPLALSVPYPGAEEWLRRLRAEGRRLFILSNKRMAPLVRLVGRYGWDGLFDGLYTGDMNPAAKRPKPVLFADALRERGIAPGDAVVVGDTAGDVEAARANGAFAIGAAWGYGGPGALDGADAVLDSPPAARG